MHVNFMSMDAEISNRVEQFLHEKRIRKEELRKKLGLGSRQQINNWVKGSDPIPVKHLVSILLLFPEINANWLVRGEGEMLLPPERPDKRIINRNEYGYCDGCVEKQVLISDLNARLKKKEEELKEAHWESGRLEERLTIYKKEQGKNKK